MNHQHEREPANDPTPVDAARETLAKIIDGVDHCDPAAEAQAIAAVAASDLLAALKATADELVSQGYATATSTTLRAALAAIAKAEGRSDD